MTKSRGVGKGNPGKVSRIYGPLFEIEWREFTSACWIWKRYVNANGYGEWKPFKGQQRSSMAHRAMYEMANGPVPTGLDLDHLCRVRCCVRPDHLEAVTRTENIRRGLHQKLTPDDILEIQRLRASKVRVKKVAQMFGISQTHVVKCYARRDRNAS